LNDIPIQIVRRKDFALVDALLHTDLPASILTDAEKEWGPIRRETARKFQRVGKIHEVPQHFAWDWHKKSQKLELLAYRCCGVECEDKVQGLMMVMLAGKNARISPDVGKPIVYIDYIESAPWNLRPMVAAPIYSGIGLVLMRTAVQLSHDEGYHGRVGLHALPQAETFYRNTCQMQGCGLDKNYQDLPYYEMTREVAARFTSDSTGGAL